jgi:hypothetical protein
MTERKYLELPPDESMEHHLLTRRIEWLTMKNSWVYRFNSKRQQQLNETYADVADFKSFSANLASIQTESTVKSSDR